MKMARNRRRWGDNDHYLGPFTFAFGERYRHFAVLLSSGDYEYPGCSLRISAFGNTMIAGLPAVIKPHTSWVDTSHYEWSKAGPDGRSGYTQVDETEYGFTISDGHLSVRRGRQTNDSSTTKDWGCFLPWTQWRHVRYSLYDLNGDEFWTQFDGASKLGFEKYEEQREFDRLCPTRSFDFLDFDDEAGIATTKITEREWRFGTGSFKWLSLFRRRKVSRSLDISFSIETGERKGSWKGGTIGHSIKMLPGELHQSAFERYCLAHDMTFVGAAA